jgi:ketosteroid isomerase-like protein
MMIAQRDIDRDKSTVDAFYRLGAEGRLSDFASYVHPDFKVTAPNYLPWGGTHLAEFFNGEILPNLPKDLDFSRFSYDSVTAEAGRVAVLANMGVTGADAMIQIADHWTVEDGRVTALWVAYFEPQALLDKLGIVHSLGRRLTQAEPQS